MAACAAPPRFARIGAHRPRAGGAPGAARPILIETTVWPIVPVRRAFFINDRLPMKSNSTRSLTMVDAKHIAQHLEDLQLDGVDNQAVDQIVCADRIVINKVDLVSAEEVEPCAARSVD